MNITNYSNSLRTIPVGYYLYCLSCEGMTNHPWVNKSLKIVEVHTTYLLLEYGNRLELRDEARRAFFFVRVFNDQFKIAQPSGFMFKFIITEQKPELKTCDHCHKEVMSFAGRVHNQYFYCEECLSHNKVCYDCHKLHSGYGNICSQCLTDNYAFCECCRRQERKISLLRVSDKSVCFHCRCTCYDCGNVVLKSNTRMVDSQPICNNCITESYSTCARCASLVHDDNARGTDEFLYCQRCYAYLNQTLHDYGYKPAPVFEKFVYENTVYLGIELEVESEACGNNQDNADSFVAWLKTEKIRDKFYLKQDSSLQNGFEIVTHPLTLQKHSQLNWTKILKHLSDYTTSHEKGTCGLHIHVNRDHFKSREIDKLALFFTCCKSHIVQFSKRKSLNYCEFYNYTTQHYKCGNYRNSGRYSAINLTIETAEFRVFRGTLRIDRFWASLQFVDALCNYVIDNSALSMTWTKFIIWAKATHRYCHMIQYFKKEELI